jgi:RecA/RadA recombinase
MGNKRKIGILLTEKDLKRRYPGSGMASEICLPDDQALRLPCEIPAINYHLGGGIKYGTIIELRGEESTGKTLLALNFVKVAQSMGGIGMWDDAESTFDGTWAQKHGVNLSKLDLLPYENEIELVSDWIADKIVYWRNKLTNNEPIVLVVDSIALLDAGDVLDTAEMDTKAEMGRRSMKMGALLRKRMKFFAKYGVCVILINQLRKKVGASMFEDPETSPMEQVMKYYASQRVGLYRGRRLKIGKGKKTTWVGNVVYVRTKKNKSSIPRDNIQAEVYFREVEGKFGYSKYFGLPELLMNRGILKRSTGKVTYKGEFVAKVKGEDYSNIISAIGSKPKLRSNLLRRLGVDTPSKFREKLEGTKRNLYPVKLKKQSDAEETSAE